MSSFTPCTTPSLTSRQVRQGEEESYNESLQQDHEMGSVTPGQQDPSSQFGELPNNLRRGGSQFTSINPAPTPDFRDLRAQPVEEHIQQGEWQLQAPQLPSADLTFLSQLQDLSLGPGNSTLDPGLEEAFAGLQARAPREFPFLDLPLNIQQLGFQYFLGTNFPFLPLARLTDRSLAVSSTSDRRWPITPLFRVSRDFYFKAVTVFYSQTTFSFEDFQALDAFLRLPDQLLRYVKRVRFSWVFFAQSAYAVDDLVNQQFNLFHQVGVALSRRASLELHITAPSSYWGRMDALTEALTRMGLYYNLHGESNSLHPFLFTLMANISSLSYGYAGRWEDLKISLEDLMEFNHWLSIRTANAEDPLGKDAAFWLEGVTAMLLRKECPPWDDDLFWQ